jgi:sugar O-acyltransferase (sialic acid O-acetyltransferase NeuD family)
MPSAAKKKVIIFGVGDFAQVARVYLDRDSDYQVAAFTLHEQYIHERNLMGLDVLPFEKLTETHPPSEYAMLVATGFKKVNKIRAELYEACKQQGYQLISYVNSRATLWGEVEMGDNCFIFENNVIQPFVRLGNDVILWSGNHIGHHAVIEDHCFISSHVVISGRARIGRRSFLGVNATIRDGIQVGAETVVGAACVILHDTPEKSVYRGAESQPTAISSDRLKGF